MFASLIAPPALALSRRAESPAAVVVVVVDVALMLSVRLASLLLEHAASAITATAILH